LAKVTTLADEHHILRFVPYARCEKDANDNVIGFLPEAFELREGEEYLSAAWLEYFDAADRAGRCAEAMIALKAQPAPKVGAKARFALGNVGEIRGACREHRQSVRISHEPVTDFDSHASVRQFQGASLELLALLATNTWSEMLLPPNAKAVP